MGVITKTKKSESSTKEFIFPKNLPNLSHNIEMNRALYGVIPDNAATMLTR